MKDCNKESNKWGGNRIGAGRKKMSDSDKKKTAVLRVPAELIELFKHLKERYQAGEDLSYLMGHHKNELYQQQSVVISVDGESESVTEINQCMQKTKKGMLCKRFATHDSPEGRCCEFHFNLYFGDKGTKN